MLFPIFVAVGKAHANPKTSTRVLTQAASAFRQFIVVVLRKFGKSALLLALLFLLIKKI